MMQPLSISTVNGIEVHYQSEEFSLKQRLQDHAYPKSDEHDIENHGYDYEVLRVSARASGSNAVDVIDNMKRSIRESEAFEYFSAVRNKTYTCKLQEWSDSSSDDEIGLIEYSFTAIVVDNEITLLGDLAPHIGDDLYVFDFASPPLVYTQVSDAFSSTLDLFSKGQDFVENVAQKVETFKDAVDTVINFRHASPEKILDLVSTLTGIEISDSFGLALSGDINSNVEHIFGIDLDYTRENLDFIWEVVSGFIIDDDEELTEYYLNNMATEINSEPVMNAVDFVDQSIGVFLNVGVIAAKAQVLANTSFQDAPSAHEKRKALFSETQELKQKLPKVYQTPEIFNAIDEVVDKAILQTSKLTDSLSTVENIRVRGYQSAIAVNFNIRGTNDGLDDFIKRNSTGANMGVSGVVEYAQSRG